MAGFMGLGLELAGLRASFIRGRCVTLQQTQQTCPRAKESKTCARGCCTLCVVAALLAPTVDVGGGT